MLSNVATVCDATNTNVDTANAASCRPADNSRKPSRLHPERSWFRDDFRKLARVPIMDIKLFHKSLENDVHNSCFNDTTVVKYNLERAVVNITTIIAINEPNVASNILGEHIDVMTNLLQATVNTDYEASFIISLGHFLQKTSDRLQHIFNVVTHPSNTNDDTDYDTTIVTSNKPACLQIMHVINFLRSSIMFNPASKLYAVFNNIELVVDLIDAAPF